MVDVDSVVSILHDEPQKPSMAKFVNGRVTVSVLRTMRDWKQHAQHADRAPVQLDTFRT